MGDHPDERRSSFASTAGGVMTDEVGAVTGELEVSTHARESGLVVCVRYAGAEEWYAVDGAPVQISGDPGRLHDLVVEHLQRPRRVVGGNEEAASLQGL